MDDLTATSGSAVRGKPGIQFEITGAACRACSSPKSGRSSGRSSSRCSVRLAAAVNVERSSGSHGACGLNHPNVVPVLSTGQVAGLPYSSAVRERRVMRARMARGPLSIRKRSDPARRHPGLAYAHASGVVHRTSSRQHQLSGSAAVVTDLAWPRSPHRAQVHRRRACVTGVGFR